MVEGDQALGLRRQRALVEKAPAVGLLPDQGLASDVEVREDVADVEVPWDLGEEVWVGCMEVWGGGGVWRCWGGGGGVGGGVEVCVWGRRGGLEDGVNVAGCLPFFFFWGGELEDGVNVVVGVGTKRIPTPKK